MSLALICKEYINEEGGDMEGGKEVEITEVMEEDNVDDNPPETGEKFEKGEFESEKPTANEDIMDDNYWFSSEELDNLKDLVVLEGDVIPCLEMSVTLPPKEEKEEILNKENKNEMFPCPFCDVSITDKLRFIEHLVSHIEMEEIVAPKEDEKSAAEKNCLDDSTLLLSPSSVDKEMISCKTLKPAKKKCRKCSKSDGGRKKRKCAVKLRASSVLLKGCDELIADYQVKATSKTENKAGSKGNRNQLQGIPIKDFKAIVKCPECQKIFANVKFLKMHLQTHENKIEKGKDVETVSKEAMTLRSFKKETIKSAKMGKWPASDEIEGRQTVEDRAASCRAKGKGNSYAKIDWKFVTKCPKCKKSFSRKTYLKMHYYRVHSDDKPFKCDYCSYQSRWKQSLQIHIATIHKQPSSKTHFQCQICKKIFGSSKDLKFHQVVHTREKPYPCGICSKSFSQPGYLKIHLRIHSGEKPYICQFCGKRDSQKGNIKNHIRNVHKNLLPKTV